MSEDDGNNKTPDRFDPEDEATPFPEVNGEEENMDTGKEAEEEIDQIEWGNARSQQQKEELDEVKELEEEAKTAEKEIESAGQINTPRNVLSHADETDKNVRSVLENKLITGIKNLYDSEVAKKKIELIAAQIIKEGRMHPVYQALRWLKLMEYFQPAEPVIDKNAISDTAFNNFSEDVKKDVEVRKGKAKMYDSDRELQERVCDNFRDKGIKLRAAYNNIENKMKKVSKEIADLEQSKKGLEKKLTIDPETNKQYLDDCAGKLADKKHIYNELQRIKGDREGRMSYASDSYGAAKTLRKISRGVSTKVKRDAQKVEINYNRLKQVQKMQTQTATYRDAIAQIESGDALAKTMIEIYTPFFDGLDGLFKHFMETEDNELTPPLKLSNIDKYNQKIGDEKSTALDVLTKLIDEN